MRTRPSPAMAVALAALFVALGGTAFALSKGSVKSKHIAKNAVSAKHIKPDQVRSSHVKDGSLSGADIADGSLSGAKIDAASLGRVPSAGDAETLGGNAADTFLSRMARDYGSGSYSSSSPPGTLFRWIDGGFDVVTDPDGEESVTIVNTTGGEGQSPPADDVRVARGDGASTTVGIGPGSSVKFDTGGLTTFEMMIFGPRSNRAMHLSCGFNKVDDRVHCLATKSVPTE